ncbi:Ig domain-containing protein [Histomonas meleagridis]|uniref:Ig domain-containing protein n=1 Tax=Histomonas meleagridis TaxID=135588 RepID=UPI00355A82A5|nr:Ig domain-containing protein [Histomonas meleagridis]KAH0804742.1 Ig domain-containing protein [Histomonas meleagridis]
MFILCYFLVFTKQLTLYANYNTTYANGNGGVHLNWTINDQEKNQTDYYKIFLNTENDSWEPISTHKWGTTIKVLNIYPSNDQKFVFEIEEDVNIPTAEMEFASGAGREYPKSASLKVWMEGGLIEGINSSAFGIDHERNQIINVTLISIDELTEELNSNQEWLYNFDVTVFGFWDYSGGVSPIIDIMEKIRKYIERGYGFIAGHDSITSGFVKSKKPQGMVAIRDLFNVTLKNFDPGTFTQLESNKTKVHKQGLLLKYPWNLTSEEVQPIYYSHTSKHKANGDIWFEFDDYIINDEPKVDATEQDNFYLTTYGNTAMIQIGHSDCNATCFERKVLANTIFYLKQRTNESEFEDHFLNLPDLSNPEINIKIDLINYSVIIEGYDVGTPYKFKVVAYNSTGYNISESYAVVNVTKGIAYYKYTFSQNEKCDIESLTNKTYDNTIKFTTEDLIKQEYLHVAPIDKQGNIGKTKTVKLNFSTNTYSQSNTFSQSNSYTQSNTFTESNTYSQSNTFSESNTFMSSNSFTASNSFTSSFPFGASLSFSYILTIYSSNVSSITQIFTQYLSDSTLIFYEYSVIHMTTIISFYSGYYTFVFPSLYYISDEPVLNSASLVGIICGSIALVLIIIGVVVWLFRISKKVSSYSELNKEFSESFSSDLDKQQQHQMIQTIGEMSKEEDDQWM